MLLITEVNQKHMAPDAMETSSEDLESAVIDVYGYESEITKPEMQDKLDEILGDWHHPVFCERTFLKSAEKFVLNNHADQSILII